MDKWNADADLMAKIHASITPIRARDTLRTVLTQDFPRDFANLPIAGGWGYTQADAIRFVRREFSNLAAANFVSLEYQIVEKIVYEELIIFKAKGQQFSGIQRALNCQKLVKCDERQYDVLEFNIECWSDWHWEQLKQEWEENDEGMRDGFDLQEHTAKREASRVRYQRIFWFDISEMLSISGTF